MNFEEGRLYHVYNRGNEKKKIFFNDENYRFFLAKVAKELTPVCDILCYCLMPNHYHLIIYVKDTGQTALSGLTGDGENCTINFNYRIHPLARKIGILQSSYAQAINKRMGRSGSLFQQKAKAKLLDEKEGYPLDCFIYIHQNPIRANLVQAMHEWQHSSYNAFVSNLLTFINQSLAKDLLDLPKDSVEFNSLLGQQLSNKTISAIL